MKKKTPFNLKAFRAEYGLTQKRLAELMDVSSAHVYRMEEAGLVDRLWIWALKGLANVLAKPQAPESQPMPPMAL